MIHDVLKNRIACIILVPCVMYPLKSLKITCVSEGLAANLPHNCIEHWFEK